MSDLPSMDPLRKVHPMWRVHVFFAGLVGVAGFICIMTGALAQLGIILLGLALLWGIAAVIVGLIQQRHDQVVPYDERKEFTNMDIE